MNKKLKLMKICTHSGTFHADESLAVYMLRQLPEFKEHELIRSRNPSDWEQSEIVIDVGGQYDGKKFFDHHQREFDETFRNFQTKLSSAGLIYKHFGKQIIGHKLGLSVDDDLVEEVYVKVYKEFIESIDANDNGINKFDESVTNKFNDKNLMLPTMISNLNPPWYDDCKDEDFDRQFQKSMALMGQVFENVLDFYGKSFVISKDIVQKGFDTRFDVDESGLIIKLDKFCPWKDQIYNLEKENNCQGQIKFVLFKDSSDKWRISTVPIASGSFEFRLGIKEEWRGIRDQQLNELIGINDAIFVHAAGFIGGAQSFESVLKMAQTSLA